MENKIEIYLVLYFLAFAVFFTGVIAFFIQYRNKQKIIDKEKQLIQQAHEQELLTAQLEIQTQTMQHIGREIHDNVGQQLTLASLYTQQLAFENKAPQVKDSIDRISNIINQSLNELRQLSKSLTDDNINSNSIAVLLKNECDKISDLKKCAVVFEPVQLNRPLSYQSKSILVRVVQEFFQNSIKHSGCTVIKLTIDTTPEFLRLYMEDNGKGFDQLKNNSRGIGLANMQKRTEMIGGTFRLTSNSNGTKMHISIPLSQSLTA